MDVWSQVLQAYKVGGHWARDVTAWRDVASRAAEYGPTPAGLDGRLMAALFDQGIGQLYRHQAIAIERALSGDHVAVVSPTASGKTLCYNLPVLQAILEDPEARALYLFPTKALAHDQVARLRAQIDSLGLGAAVAAYDGDTPSAQRSRVRDAARVLISNPDMLHLGILPHHPGWHAFFSRLRYVVLDEIHSYRGVFGSHVANVVRRFRRICRFYGSDPQFICCSATIDNPQDLTERIVGRPVHLVARSGAPTERRTVLFYNPPLVDRHLGIRRSALWAARDQANHLLEHGLQIVVFTRSRLAVEQLTIQLRRDARGGGHPSEQIRGYRGGYLARERREIEEGLRDGRVRCVVATSALELGVDIGTLSACLLVGYPGSIASTWQRIGRVGRGTGRSLAVLIADSSPTDQYLVTHPDYFFDRSVERALVNPDNLHVLLNHVRCAAYELPFRDGASYGQVDTRALFDFLARRGELHLSAKRWFWMGGGYPAGDVSLRTALADRVSICCIGAKGTSQTIGQVDRASAPRFVHPDAIYMHEGQQYRVRELDWESAQALVEPVDVDYYTRASESSRIDVESVLEEQEGPGRKLCMGHVRLTSRVTGYRRLRLYTEEHLGWGDLDLPEQSYETQACWLMIPQAVEEALRERGLWTGSQGGSRGPNWVQQRARARARDGYRCAQCGAPEREGRQHDVHHIRPFRSFAWIEGENDNYVSANMLENLITLCPACHRKVEEQALVQTTLTGLGHVLRHLLPLILMCDGGDVGVLSDARGQQTGRPTLFIYDAIPGGIGLAWAAMQACDELLAKAMELVRDCGCENGCPSCIGAAAGDQPDAKAQVRALIAALGCEDDSGRQKLDAPGGLD